LLNSANAKGAHIRAAAQMLSKVVWIIGPAPRFEAVRGLLRCGEDKGGKAGPL
jgi:hypothetical protein